MELEEALELFGRVVDAFSDEERGSPSLGEFLEIAGSSEPANSAFSFPLVFKAKIAGNRLYKANLSERVSGLNDNTFNEAAELLAFLIEHADSDSDQPASPSDVAGHLLQVLQAAKFSFSDISSENVVDLTVKVPKRFAKAKRGDVVAIPAAEHGYHLAVVLSDDQAGLALGLLKGVFSAPRVGRVDQHLARHIPVYTGDGLIKNGTWRVVGHNEVLLDLFPDPPELYWGAVTAFGDRFGDYGAAGVVGEPKRLIGKAEAEVVGLLNNTYRQTYVDEYFQKVLNEGRFDNGPLPGTFR
ncbi:hypothetical protein [Lentzea sp. NPDC055074]